MNLTLDVSLGSGYASNSQKARRITEGWAGKNLYCAACSSPRLAAHRNNRAVEDFHCPGCGRQVQLKAKRGGIGRVISNSAYAKKMTAIEANRAPDYCFMGYSDDWLVENLIWVPGHFITKSVVARRNELGPDAQRAGWVGSNILLHLVPAHGRIPLVLDGTIRPPLEVREQFQSMAFLQRLPSEERGWIGDVLACIEDRAERGQTFTNDDVYACDDYLAKLHPGNHNIRPKIRQQLQVLVRQGVVERLRPGVYRRV